MRMPCGFGVGVLGKGLGVKKSPLLMFSHLLPVLLIAAAAES